MAVEDNPTRLGRLSARLAGIRDGTDDDTLSAGFLLVATVLALVWANIGTTRHGVVDAGHVALRR